MKKMAIFCEGLTEQLYAVRLVTAVMGRKALVTQSKMRGKQGRRSVTIIDGLKPLAEHLYQVQIINSGNDETVASDVRESYETLVERGGYSSIVALRDVYPNDRKDIPRMLTLSRKYIPTKPIEVIFVLAIMEIEAWFIAEHTHFPKVHASLTHELVKSILGIDPRIDNTEHLAHPAGELNRVYGSVGESYEKRRASISRTIEALDIDRLFLELGDRYKSVQQLNMAISAFMG
ncbi:MAG: hypothetical protein QM770_20195 [Tepidisphaeraceae bacterium]